MALFKTFRGKRADLGAQELRDGFAYFCTDDGTFHIDFLDTDGTVKRKQINAKDAETLLGHSIEEFLIASENGSFAHGDGAAATGTNSYAGGYKTLAGGKGFKITGFEDNGNGTGKYTLSSVTGLETEMRYSAVLSSANYNAGKIIEIVGNVVTVDGYKDIEFNSNADNADEFNVYNFLTIVDRPDLGDREVGFNAHTEGENTIASNKAAHAEGSNTKAIGKFAHAEGNGTIAGHAAHAEGQGNTASGWAAHAEGYNTFASANNAHAEGDSTTASANNAHAEGYNTFADGWHSHAEGENTIASNKAAHAEGSNTKAIGKFAHAEGNGTIAGHAAHAEGQGNTASGWAAHAEGEGNTASGWAAHAEGGSTQALGDLSHSEGNRTKATGNYSHTEGDSTTASGKNAHAEGISTTASGENAHAEGLETQSTGNASHAEGRNTKATGWRSHAEGDGTVASAGNAHAEGSGTTASANNAHAEGISTTASGEGAHSEGRNTKAIGWRSHAEGASTTAKGEAAHAEGYNTKAIGGFAHAEGEGTLAKGEAAHAEGGGTQALGALSHAEGGSTQATGNYSHTEGDSTTASGKNAHAEGYNTFADGEDAHSEGRETKAIGKFAHAEGNGTIAGHAAHAEGQGNTASGWAAHAEGEGNTASGWAAHAEGGSTQALGDLSHSEGHYSKAYGEYSHAEGQNTTASGQDAHAEGYYTSAEELGAHAGGLYSHAKTKGSFVHGRYLNATAVSQFVVGEYNKEDPDALFIVGGGESEGNRKNLFTVKKDGSITGLNTSNALTKTVSGEAIAIADASPIEHEMAVKVRGKNLINMSAVTIPSGQSYSYENRIATISQGTYGYVPRARWDFFDVSMFEGKTLTVSLDVTEDQGTNTKGNIIYIQGISDKEYALKTHGFTQTGKITLTYTFSDKLDYDKIRIMLYAQHLTDASESLSFTNVQFEMGTTATTYTPYIEDISTVKVKKYGKNLFEGTTTLKEHRGITFELLDDGTYHVYGTNDGTGASYLDHYLMLPAGKYTGSGCPQGGSRTTYRVEFYNQATSRGSVDYGNGVVFEVAATQRFTVQMMVKSGQTVDLIFKPMIEVGAGDKVYEPYKEPIEYPVSADGTVEGVTPIYPTTTLMTDTAGAVIDCTYNRDINRVLDDTGFMYDHNPSGTGSFSMNRKVGSEIGEYSHAEGYSSAAIGKASHAGGEATQAKGVGSFAHGQRVTADADYQATFGTHNEANTNAALIVGNGASTAKSNAFEVQKDGNAFVKGDLYIGGTGSTQASAKQVATKDSLSAMEQRINNLEDITSSTGGVFFEDADVAYVKTIPENIAPYASLNKVGGMGIYQKKIVNLMPADYEANGQVYEGYTFNSSTDGVITITDATPPASMDDPLGGEFNLGSLELPAGTYTIAIEKSAINAPPFGIAISGFPGSAEEVRVGGAWNSNMMASPYTFTLEESAVLQLRFEFSTAVGASSYTPTGVVASYTYHIMLNEGYEAAPWEPYSENATGYVEPPKVTSIEVTGKNVFDYGVPRILSTENYDDAYYWYDAYITAAGALNINTIGLEAAVTTWSFPVEGINTARVYPAGKYSLPRSIPFSSTNTQDTMLLTLQIKYTDEISSESRTVYGGTFEAAYPFTITAASVILSLAEETHYMTPSNPVPLTMVKGDAVITEATPYTLTKINIPEEIVSRDDYGIGVYRYGTYTLYNNYIDFESKKFVKRCLSMDLTSSETFIYYDQSPTDHDLVSMTLKCSDPTVICELSIQGPHYACFQVYREYPGDCDDYLAQAADSGNPVKVFYGAYFAEEIDISKELAHIDNYIPVEVGGLIYFNNDQKAAVPSTIEYQSMMKKGEIEEL